MSEAPKIGVLLVNLGTPKSFHIRDVRTYLREFLSDPRVLTLPSAFRSLLVNFVIVPFRSKFSAKAYASIWKEEGSPLLYYGMQIKKLLQESLGNSYSVELAMRYQYPKFETILESLLKKSLKKLIVIPLFPQYASATTGSIIEKLFHHLKNKPTIPSLSLIHHFYDHPLLIEAFVNNIESCNLSSYDHLLLSFHGLPKDQLVASNPYKTCQGTSSCCQKIHAKNHQCYSAQCHYMGQLIANALKLEKKDFSICFQSRLGKSEWLKPYTLETIKELAQSGVKRLLIACPSFICDCLETLYEIQIEYEHHFKMCGGHTLKLVEGLNTHDLWIKTLVDIVEKENGTQCLKTRSDAASANISLA